MHKKDRKCIFSFFCAFVFEPLRRSCEQLGLRIIMTEFLNSHADHAGSPKFLLHSLAEPFNSKVYKTGTAWEFDSNYTWIDLKKFASWCWSDKAGGRRSKFSSFFCLSWVFSPVHSLFSSEPRRGQVQSSGKVKTCTDHARSPISFCMVETSDLS